MNDGRLAAQGHVQMRPNLQGHLRQNILRSGRVLSHVWRAQINVHHANGSLDTLKNRGALVEPKNDTAWTLGDQGMTRWFTSLASRWLSSQPVNRSRYRDKAREMAKAMGRDDLLERLK